jgi:Recombination endonuclease VII
MRTADAIRSKRWRERHPERAAAATKGWRDRNKGLSEAINKSWRKKQPTGYNSAVIRKWTYGISEEEFQTRIATQDNRCAICLDVFTKTPQVDHNHVTGKNRDLLCRFCNLVLGNAKDRIAVLKRAVDYLKKHEDIMKKHKYSHSHIEHHKDGSHTVHHVHEDGPHKDHKSAVGSHDELMDNMMDHTSTPNPGESSEPMQGAAPAAAAAPPGVAGAPPAGA